MSRQDAQKVAEHLEKANEHASRVKDPNLTKKIGDAIKHVQEKLDAQKGG